MISPKWQYKHEIKHGAIILQHVLNAFTRDEILRRFKHSEHIQNLGFLAVMKIISNIPRQNKLILWLAWSLTIKTNEFETYETI